MFNISSAKQSASCLLCLHMHQNNIHSIMKVVHFIKSIIFIQEAKDFPYDDSSNQLYSVVSTGIVISNEPINTGVDTGGGRYLGCNPPPPIDLKNILF